MAKHAAGGRVLDAGGGNGAIMEGWDTIVLDLDKQMPKAAHAAGRPALVGDMEALPFRDESVDTVLMCHSLEHCPHTERALADAGRVLRPAGHLVVVAPNSAGLRQIHSLLTGDVRPAGNRPADAAQHQHHYTLALLRQLLASQPWIEVREVRGDAVSVPLMRTLRLRWLSRVIGWVCPRLSDAIIAVCRKREAC